MITLNNVSYQTENVLSEGYTHDNLIFPKSTRESKVTRIQRQTNLKVKGPMNKVSEIHQYLSKRYLVIPTSQLLSDRETGLFYQYLSIFDLTKGEAKVEAGRADEL